MRRLVRPVQSPGSLRSMIIRSPVMHQSILPVPISPRATPGHLFRFSIPGMGHFWTLMRPPGIWYMQFQKPSKSWAVKLRVLLLRGGGFHGKRYGFRVTVACPRRTKQACWDFFRGEFLILESFKCFIEATIWTISSIERSKKRTRTPLGGGGCIRYFLEWGGAARPLKPWPCLRRLERVSHYCSAC